jgi:hypothetical protein
MAVLQFALLVPIGVVAVSLPGPVARWLGLRAHGLAFLKGVVGLKQRFFLYGFRCEIEDS